MADEPDLRTVSLDQPIVRGEQSINQLQIRKPTSGELRGLNFADLVQLNVDALNKLIPRITMPPVTLLEAGKMDPADTLAIGVEVADFLLQKRAKPDSLAA